MTVAKRNRPGLVDDGLEGLTYQTIGFAMAVHNDLGPGHREETYHKCHDSAIRGRWSAC